MACGLKCLRSMAELNSASFPHKLNIFAWPFTLVLQTSVEFYKCIPLAFHALISASDRRNVKHRRQYHLGLWEWFSSGSQKMGKKKTSKPIMFCYSTAFKCSSLLFWIRWRLWRLIAGWTGCQSSAGCALVAPQSHKPFNLCSLAE